MITYIKAILLITALAMATQTIVVRGNEELGILYLILFASFRELWEIDNDTSRQPDAGRRRNSKTSKTGKGRRERKNRSTK